jgi:hypothetical protein
MSVTCIVTCPCCHDQLNCDVDIEVTGGEREGNAIVMDVESHLTSESLARIKAHTLTH